MGQRAHATSSHSDYAVFLFHRDLRIVDNTTLNYALQHEPHIALVFIFDPIQIDRRKNKYFSNAAVQFMCESLSEIPHLNIFVGDTVDVLSSLRFSALYQNRDVSYFAKERDARIEKLCKDRNVPFVTHPDFELFGDVRNKQGSPYLVFKPFYDACMQLHVPRPHSESIKPNQLVSLQQAAEKMPNCYEYNARLEQRGGRSQAMKMLHTLHDFEKYGKTRDYPKTSTTKASAHIRFGTLSIREMYWACIELWDKHHPLIRELIFREFYYKLYSSNPRLQRDVAVKQVVDTSVPWKWDADSKRIYAAWTRGETGFPFVDAGMRELMYTGWMHNRARMVTANFLSKLCLIDWRRGLKHFHCNLVDCDPCSNAAGWQWSASVGADAMPAFRIFNPFRQSFRFDPNAEYIKTWIPELRDVPAKDIHNWNDQARRYGTYVAPIIDYVTAAKRSKQIFSTHR